MCQCGWCINYSYPCSGLCSLITGCVPKNVINSHTSKYDVFRNNISSVIYNRLVKMVTSKPVNRLPTGNRFSEHITSYQICRTSNHTSCQHNPGNVDGWVWPLPGRILHTRIVLPWVPSPPFSRYSNIINSFWTSVLATGRLSTSTIYVCCPNTWTVLYFWMDFLPQASDVSRFLVVLWHVSRVRCSLAQTEFAATVAQTHIGQHAVRSKNDAKQR